MNRRDFIRRSSTTALGAMATPYILPSGRLFAPTGSRLANHVVLCLFAGGIRSFESAEMREGNLMPNLLAGDAPISADIRDGVEEVAPALDRPLQHSGTLFTGFRYASPITLHYNGHATYMIGRYADTVEMMKPIHSPTVFELFRKHSPHCPDALNAWWVSDQAGPFPYLRSSSDDRYGPAYAANMVQPSALLDSGVLQVEQQPGLADHVQAMAQLIEGPSTNQVHLNGPQARARIMHVLDRLQADHARGPLWNVPYQPNDDLTNMYTASLILREFRPELLVVNMQDSDIGHSDFTGYCNNLHKADHAAARLWQTIQSDPELRDDTVMILVPEFGRNATPNTVRDRFGRLAVDHTGDEVSQRIFSLIAGPDHIVRRDAVEEGFAEAVDILPTIARILGFHDQVPPHTFTGRFLHEAFVDA